MTAPVLTSKLDRESPEAKQRAAHNRALAEDLRAKVAQAALGGSERHRERHVARGKLLPRDRIKGLLDDDAPFLEFSALAGHGLYEDDVQAGGIVRKRFRDAHADTSTPVRWTTVVSSSASA